jgi:lipoprotein-anchoring transpeptidase ErfK/SrfK
MKKSIFFGLWVAGLISMAASGFSAESPVEKTTDKKSVAAEASKSSSGEELLKDEGGALKKSDLTKSEAEPVAIATVSPDVEAETKKEKVKKAEVVKKEEAAKKEDAVSKDSYQASAEKKTDEPTAERETSSSLNSAAMQRRWESMFSKEITLDSIAYVVKPGDSLYVIAQKNHTTVEFIKKINDLKGDNIYPQMKLKIHTAPFSIQIDKSKNVLVLYSNGEAVKKYSVATGKKNCTPVGEFKITDKLVNPTWFKTGAILPPGSPENALGTRWMGFDKPSYGIHGTIMPKSIGSQASEGCVRMLNKEVEELYSVVPVGTKVTIQD